MEQVSQASSFLTDLLSNLADGIMTFLPAVLILFVTWIVARILRGAVSRLLSRTNVDNRLAGAVGGTGGFSIEGILGTIVFWLVMLFGINIALGQLDLGNVSQPISDLVSEVTGFIPNLLSAAVLGLIAWVIATVVRKLILGVTENTNLDERLSAWDSEAVVDGQVVEKREATIGPALATAAFYLIFLLFLPAILDALGMDGLLAPINDMMSDLLGFLPNLFGAAIIGVVGYFIARIVRQIVSSLLAATPLDNMVSRAGMNQKASSLIGLFLFAFIMLVVVTQALDALRMPAISGPATSMIGSIFDVVPRLIGAVVILGVSYLIGRLISGLVTELLTGVGFNDMPARLGLGNFGGNRTASEMVGYLVLIGTMLLALGGAANALQFDTLTQVVDGLLPFAGNVVLAAVFIGIGLWLANFVAGLLKDSGASNFVVSLARFAVTIFAVFMGLQNVGVGGDIVNLAFGLMLGAVAIAAGLAFGLGGRETAGRELERFVNNIRE